MTDDYKKDQEFIENTSDQLRSLINKHHGEVGESLFFNLLDAVAYYSFWRGFLIGTVLTVIVAILTTLFV